MGETSTVLNSFDEKLDMAIYQDRYEELSFLIFWGHSGTENLYRG